MISQGNPVDISGEVIRFLVDEIGPRPAGSAAEQKAHAYLKQRMQDWGYQAAEQDVSFSDSSIRVTPFLVCVLLILSGWLYPYIPQFTILFPVFNLFIPNLIRLESRLHPQRRVSTNLFFTDPALDGNLPLLIFCAHVDTARVIPFRSPVLLQVYGKFMTVMQRAAMLVAILSLFFLLGMQPPGWMNLGAGVLSSIVGGTYLILAVFHQFKHAEKYSPGAVDNASGVGVCCALAGYFHEHPPKRLRTGFLLTTAEESGMHGAQAFARSLSRQKGKSGMVNLDMVGAGQHLCLVLQAGILLPARTSKQFNQLLHDVHPAIRNVTYTLRGGDFEPFVRHGFPAASIETRGSDRAEIAYHTLQDRFDLVEKPTCQMVTETCIRFVERLSYSDWMLK